MVKMVGLQRTTEELLFWCFCHLVLSGIAIELKYVRVVVPEGDEAVLPCSLSTKEDLTLKLFDWKKDGQKEVFLYDAGSHYNNGRQGQDEQFKGRVFHFEDKLKNGDASITIRQTTVADSGNYTCVFPRHEGQTFLIELVVAAAKPSVKILHQSETWALLQCKVLSARPEPTVKWQDSAGNKLPDKERDVTKCGDHFSVVLLTTVTKTDNFSCVVTQEDISHQTEAEIDVRLSVRVVVHEGDEALLPCSLSTKEDLTGQRFDWRKDGQKEVFLYEAGTHDNNSYHGQDEQFKGRVFHFEDELKNGDASIKIINAKVADTGAYTCDFPFLQPPQMFDIELVVGAAYEPYVRILHHTKDWSLLLCEVLNAHPEPTVKWQNSAGNVLPDKEREVTKSGDHFNVILLATVTKTDNYRCVVTQEEISRQTKAETYVYISGAAPKPGVSIRWTVAAVTVAVFCTLLVGIFAHILLFWRSRTKLMSKRGSHPISKKEEVHLKAVYEETTPVY
uniref:butyrophilin-like protein 2 n=1 Tax=Scatophagus argus TaxID=75038 RepID=UPI001ED7F59A|nr:butyrophilin-like protein 2 [Scatophagus argus]